MPADCKVLGLENPNMEVELKGTTRLLKWMQDSLENDGIFKDVKECVVDYGWIYLKAKCSESSDEYIKFRPSENGPSLVIRTVTNRKTCNDVSYQIISRDVDCFKQRIYSAAIEKGRTPQLEMCADEAYLRTQDFVCTKERTLSDNAKSFAYINPPMRR